MLANIPEVFPFLKRERRLAGAPLKGHEESSLQPPSVKLSTDKSAYRPGDTLLATIEVLCDKELPLLSPTEFLLLESLIVQVKGIEKLDPQWLLTPEVSCGSKERRERGKVSRGKFCKARNWFCETIGSLDPVDLLSIYAYIAKSEANEAMVKEKRKRDEETAWSLKRATKSNNKKEEGPPPKPTPEVVMEEAPKNKKQDPVDSLSVYAYIAKCEANEAMVEEKRIRDVETARSLKRASRSSNKKEEGPSPKPTPEVVVEDAPKNKKQGLVPDIQGSADADASSELCRAWGQVWDQQPLVFFDPGARANFIPPQLAEKMGIKTDEMGFAYTASMTAPGHEVTVTPLIGKLRLHTQGYVGHEEFFIMPLEGCDVLLGMPWFYNHKAVLDSFNKTVTLEIKGRKFVLDVKLKGESMPLVSDSAVPRLMKQHIYAYLIYVKERDETESSNFSSLDVSRRAFLDEITACDLSSGRFIGELDADEAREFFARIGIKLALTTSYNPEDLVRTVLPKLLPPTYKGTVIRYLYYFVVGLQWSIAVIENGNIEHFTPKTTLLPMELKTFLNIWTLPTSSGLSTEEPQTKDYWGIVPQSAVQVEIYWKEKNDENDWARASDVLSEIEDEDASQSTESLLDKGSLMTSFERGIQLQSPATTPRAVFKDSLFQRPGVPGYGFPRKPAMLTVSSFASGDGAEGKGSWDELSRSNHRLTENDVHDQFDSKSHEHEFNGPSPRSPSGTYARGRSYNIRFDDQVLARFSPRNPDSTYYFGDVVGGVLSFFHEEGSRRCLEISAVLETREMLNPAFIHPSRKNSPVITKVQAEFNEAVADMLQTHFVFSIPFDGPPSFTTPQVSLQWVLRFEFVTSARDINWSLYEHPLLIEDRDKGEWSLPIVVHAPLPKTQKLKVRRERPSSPRRNSWGETASVAGKIPPPLLSLPPSSDKLLRREQLASSSFDSM
ncbi:hypothetical protein L7F22_038573 [Adiantum nelumboides]|nr:hypothetical protein [Adiantum nelumboides]